MYRSLNHHLCFYYFLFSKNLSVKIETCNERRVITQVDLTDIQDPIRCGALRRVVRYVTIIATKKTVKEWHSPSSARCRDYRRAWWMMRSPVKDSSGRSSRKSSVVGSSSTASRRRMSNKESKISLMSTFYTNHGATCRRSTLRDNTAMSARSLPSPHSWPSRNLEPGPHPENGK